MTVPNSEDESFDQKVPSDASDLRRAVENGRCFRVEFRSVVSWFEHVETVGPVMHETHLLDGEKDTVTAGTRNFEAAVSAGEIREVNQETLNENA
jgi:hypothetical protein